MSALKTGALLCGLLIVAMPGLVSADTRVIIGQSYGKHTDRYLNDRASLYQQRHNFGNKYDNINPYLNHDFGNSRYQDSRHVLRRFGYSDRFNSLQRHNFGNKYDNINPYLNHDFGNNRYQDSRHVLRRSGYSDRFNSLQRHGYGYQRPDRYRSRQYDYRRGYKEGFIDGYRIRKPRSGVGNQ